MYDLHDSFWTAIGFLIAYRAILAFGGWIAASIAINDKFSWHWSICMLLGFTGFIVGALELMVFAAIYQDFVDKKDSKDAKEGAGELQKGCQSSEGVLEALPEVIMQSVFYMRYLYFFSR